MQVSRNRQLRQLTLEFDDSQARTALRPDYDESYSTTDAIGHRPAIKAIRRKRALTRSSKATFSRAATYSQPGRDVFPIRAERTCSPVERMALPV